MEAKDKDYFFHAIQSLMELIERTNEMIRLHQSQESPNELVIRSYQNRKQKLAEQLGEVFTEVFSEYDVVIPMPTRMRQVA
jgi:hypothetical protein